jgi:type VI protein secretion system component VasF
MTQHDLSYWEEMAQRYFLAETTDEEEQRLRKFLCTKEAQDDARFDEIRATLSYLHVSRVQHKLSLKHPFRALAVAACLGAVAFLGWYQYQQQNISSVRIAGQTIEADASQLMEQQLAEMFSSTNP